MRQELAPWTETMLACWVKLGRLVQYFLFLPLRLGKNTLGGTFYTIDLRRRLPGIETGLFGIKLGSRWQTPELESGCVASSSTTPKPGLEEHSFSLKCSCKTNANPGNLGKSGKPTPEFFILRFSSGNGNKNSSLTSLVLFWGAFTPWQRGGVFDPLRWVPQDCSAEDSLYCKRPSKDNV